MADTRAAATYPLNALEKIPGVIEQYKVKNEALEKDIPPLREIAGKVWKKEDELKALKSEMAALDRKIQLELTPSAIRPATEEMQTEDKTRKEEKNQKPGNSSDSFRQQTNAVRHGVKF